MKRIVTATLLTLCLSTQFAIAEAKTSVIEGKIVKMVPSQKEIYVMSEGKKYEYYFSDKTKVMQGDKEVQYSAMSEGQSVRVTANQVGKRLDPTQVEVLEAAH